eukprot:SAG11_NODE_2861_length_2898_cov_3.495534_2_plen_230_part_00
MTRLEVFLQATFEAREKLDGERDLCQESIAALKAAAGADAGCKREPENAELRLQTAVLYTRADSLLGLAAADESGKIADGVKAALNDKHETVKTRLAALVAKVDASALEKAIAADGRTQEDSRLSEAVAGVMSEWDARNQSRLNLVDVGGSEEGAAIERELHGVARSEYKLKASAQARYAHPTARPPARPSSSPHDPSRSSIGASSLDAMGATKYWRLHHHYCGPPPCD